MKLVSSLVSDKTSGGKESTKLGYQMNQEGEWEYTGDSDKEPVDEDVVSKKRMKTSRSSPAVSQENNIAGR